MAERCPITGTSLYLVLKSNDLPRPKIRLKKFGFSPIDTPANIAKKLPLQCCSKPLLIPFFNFSHNCPTFAFASESGYTPRLSEKNRTQRLTRRNRGLPFIDHSVAMCCQRNPFYSTMLLYTYISRFSVTPTISNPAELPPPTLFPNRSSLRFQLLSQMAHVCFHRRKWVHTRLSEKDRTQGHTRRNRGRFERGGITTLDTYCTFTNIPGPGVRTANFAAFGPWSGVLPKNTESLRNSDALMRVAVPKASRPRWAA